eukprot:scaffold9766_cov268-Amphora_coffeaeformis.AAC.9
MFRAEGCLHNGIGLHHVRNGRFPVALFEGERSEQRGRVAQLRMLRAEDFRLAGPYLAHLGREGRVQRAAFRRRPGGYFQAQGDDFFVRPFASFVRITGPIDAVRGFHHGLNLLHHGLVFGALGTLFFQKLGLSLVHCQGFGTTRHGLIVHAESFVNGGLGVARVGNQYANFHPILVESRGDGFGRHGR